MDKEYEIQGFYFGNWEVVTTEETKQDAFQALNDYQTNVPETAFRIVRVK